LVFLVFDIEITLLLQLPLLTELIYWKRTLFYLLIFWILLVFILEEIRRGLLSWRKWKINLI
jgi:NADH:ubiquinone oxidoreductase subunit 3 (subunit A)